jgi:Mrp family chromosome partitioning ATPase
MRSIFVGTPSPEQVALLTDYDINSAYSRAYYTTYANIRFSQNSEQNRQQAILLAIPAAYPGQVAAANVAIAAAQNSTATILVDADSQRPGLDRRFGIEVQAGLSDLLLANEAITPQVLAPYLSETFVPGLRLLSMGKKTMQPQEISRLLSNKLPEILASMRQLLDAGKSKLGLIIFTSAPVLESIDASQISALVDQTFLLIASGRTTRTQVVKAQEQMQRAHANLAGIIILDV